MGMEKNSSSETRARAADLVCNTPPNCRLQGVELLQHVFSPVLGVRLLIEVDEISY